MFIKTVPAVVPQCHTPNIMNLIVKLQLMSAYIKLMLIVTIQPKPMGKGKVCMSPVFFFGFNDRNIEDVSKSSDLKLITNQNHKQRKRERKKNTHMRFQRGILVTSSLRYSPQHPKNLCSGQSPCFGLITCTNPVKLQIFKHGCFQNFSTLTIHLKDKK